MIGILGEDYSDTETLKILAKRILNDNSLSIKGKGYGGCGELIRKGAKDIVTLNKLGCTSFVICSDADGDATVRQKSLTDLVATPSGCASICCVIVPVEELEAWILADIASVASVITGWRECAGMDIRNPQSVRSPKEKLEELSRGRNYKPRYSHASHNPAVARFLDIEKVSKKCESFLEFKNFLLR